MGLAHTWPDKLDTPPPPPPNMNGEYGRGERPRLMAADRPLPAETAETDAGGGETAGPAGLLTCACRAEGTYITLQ